MGADNSKENSQQEDVAKDCTSLIVKDNRLDIESLLNCEHNNIIIKGNKFDIPVEFWEKISESYYYSDSYSVSRPENERRILTFTKIQKTLLQEIEEELAQKFNFVIDPDMGELKMPTKEVLQDMISYIENVVPQKCFDNGWTRRDRKELIQGDKEFALSKLPTGELDYVYLSLDKDTYMSFSDFARYHEIIEIMEENNLTDEFFENLACDYRAIYSEFKAMQNDVKRYENMKRLIVDFFNRWKGKATILFSYQNGGDPQTITLTEKVDNKFIDSMFIGIGTSTPASVIELSMKDNFGLMKLNNKVKTAMYDLMQYIKKDTTQGMLLD